MAAEPQQPEKETVALSHVSARLKAQFPDLAPSEIESTVRAQHELLANSRICDFLPVLIERAARAELESRRTATPVEGAAG